MNPFVRKGQDLRRILRRLEIVLVKVYDRGDRKFFQSKMQSTRRDSYELSAIVDRNLKVTYPYIRALQMLLHNYILHMFFFYLFINRWRALILRYDNVNFIGDYNLNFNGTLMVKNHSALMLTLDNLADTSESSGLTFKKLCPSLQQTIRVIWKREVSLSPVAELFLKSLKEEICKDCR